MTVQMVGWGSSLSISSDGLTVSNPSNSGGYKSAKCNATISSSDIGQAGAVSKRMFEVKINSYSTVGDFYIGICENLIGPNPSYVFGYSAAEYGYGAGGAKITSYYTSGYGLSFSPGDIVGVLMEIPSPLTSGIKLSFAKNGVIQGLAFTITNISTLAVVCRFYYAGQSITYNFGDQGSFDYPIFGYNGYLGGPIRTDPTTFEGLNIDDDYYFSSIKVTNKLGTLIEDQLSGSRLISNSGGFVTDPPLLGDRLISNSTGLMTDPQLLGDRIISSSSGLMIDHLLTGNRLIPNNPGAAIDDIKSGQWSSSSPGSKIDNVILGDRLLASSQFAELIEVDIGYRTHNYEGVEVGEVMAQSNAENTYLLTVNPTHQFRNQVVSVNFSTRTGIHIYGKYKVIIGDTELITYGEENSDISNINFTISPGTLTTGINKCRIQLLYITGIIEQLDFEILKEDTKRTVVERLFREYDGGFSGDHVCPPYIYASNIFPCFFVPYSQSSTFVQTTPTTRIALSKYLNIQGVNIAGSGLTILVSFDKGLTWKSFINNSWKTIDIANIATSGMTQDIINGITLAQWSDIFTPTSLDFAILFSNSGSYTHINGGDETLISRVTGLWTNTTYTASSLDPSLKFSRVSADDGGAEIRITTNKQSIYQVVSMASVLVPYDELASGISVVARSSYLSRSVYAKPKQAYLKSINVQITPNPKTGHAFIM